MIWGLSETREEPVLICRFGIEICNKLFHFPTKFVPILFREHVSVPTQVATSESVESPPTAAFLRTLTTAMHLDAGGAGLLEGLVSKVRSGLVRVNEGGWVDG